MNFRMNDEMHCFFCFFLTTPYIFPRDQPMIWDRIRNIKWRKKRCLNYFFHRSSYIFPRKWSTQDSLIKPCPELQEQLQYFENTTDNGSQWFEVWSLPKTSSASNRHHHLPSFLIPFSLFFLLVFCGRLGQWNFNI